MLIFEPWKKALIGFVLLFGLVSTLPNFYYEDVQRANDARQVIAQYARGDQTPPPALVQEASLWPSWLPSGLVNLGLDLQGGAHFLLEVQIDEVLKQRMERLDFEIGPALRAAEVRRYRKVEQGAAHISVRITNAEDVERAAAALEGLAEPLGDPLLGVIGTDLDVVAQADQTFRLQLSEAAMARLGENTVDAAIEVIRTRVDALGTREPTVVREGENRILLQLPGANNVDIDEITKQAKLEFRLVVDADPNAPPPGSEVFSFDPVLNEEAAGARIVVEERIRITGDQLAEAGQGFDQNNRVGVNIRFDATGARIFGDLSRDNVGRQFAMILDGQVLSAPVFNEYIPSGAAIITGSFDIESANALAVNLASGSLPAEVTVEESSFVGPELGADSIEAGKWACIIGFILVLVYMGVSYGLFGLFANIALILNVMLIFGALSLFGATLTLPGIAGVVLTIGMAVDANVLVFERIREELRRGRNVARAIETGYNQALTAIIDANVTTLIAAVILFAMGSGPVRGFSITLGVGIVTSVFTAVMLTRLFVATWYGWKRPKELAL